MTSASRAQFRHDARRHADVQGEVDDGRVVLPASQPDQVIREQLLAAERLAASLAGQFSDIVTAITSYADLLLRDLGPADARRADVRAIRVNAERALRLSERLETVARRARIMPVALDLDAFVAGMTTHLEASLGPGIRLERRPGHVPQPWVSCDRQQLTGVLTILAGFARARMPDGGTFIIATEVIPATGPPKGDAGDAAYGKSRRGTRAATVRLSVTDSGPALDEAATASLFEPYGRAAGSTGIDLAASHGIVAGFGGSLHAVASSGTGSAQGLALAIDLPAIAREDDLPPAGDHPRGGSESILLVDGEDAARGHVAGVLRQLGYSVQDASTAGDALALADDYFADPVDLLITDVSLPDLTGPELVERLLLDRPHLDVLYISSGPMARPRRRRSWSAAKVLREPFEADELAGRVRDVLDARAGRLVGPTN